MDSCQSVAQDQMQNNAAYINQNPNYPRSISSGSISDQIKQEIQRFESVHPCIYTIYDLVELIDDRLIAQQIRDHVVCIEDSFVNSQEWTLSRSVSDLKLGVLGGLSSGKTALVHRYLTGSYMQEESPEGGRFKKEVVIDGHSLLLLIRDEGGPPDQQFSHWVDGVIFVFSLNDEISFNAVYEYYAKLAYYRNTADIPLILVGTQDAISDKRPRVIDDLRAKKLAHDLKRCTYYETCATYGLNVERVFREACTKIIQQRIQSQMAMASPSPGLGVPVPPPVGSCPTTPGHHSQQGVVGQRSQYPPDHNHSHHHGRSQSATVAQRNGPNSNSRCSPNQLQNSSANVVRAGGQNLHNSTPGYFAVPNVVPAGALYQQQQYLSESHRPLSSSGGSGGSHGPRQMTGISPTSSNQSISSVQNQNQTNHQMVQQNNLGISQGGFDQETRFFPRQLHSASSSALRTPGHGAGGRLSSQPSDFAPADFGDGPPACPVATPGGHGTNQGPTPMSTPTSQRKNRRISNIFRGPKDKENHHDEVKFRNGELGLGSGRAIPSKQGHLYKRSTKGALNKEWKKKYVCLCSDGTLAYYPNLRDYMEDSNGKKIELRLTTVKVPGQQIPKGAQRSHTQPITSVLTPGQRSLAKENSFPDLNARILNGGLAAQASRSGSGGSAEKSERVTLTSFEPLKDDLQLQENSGEEATTSGKSTEEVLTPSVEGKKKRHHLRRVAGGGEPEEGEFIIVSSDQKKWYFSAANDKERDEWVGAITDEIGRCLQDQSGTGRGGGRPMSARNPASCCREEVQTLRSLPGNELCADCGAESMEMPLVSDAARHRACA